MRKWGDAGFLNAQQFFDDDGRLWFRHPDGESVFRVTLDELPRADWPRVV